MKRFIISLTILLLPLITLAMDNKQEISPKEFDQCQTNLPAEQPHEEPKKFVTYGKERDHKEARKLRRQKLWRSFKQSFCCCCPGGYYDDSDL